jgi:hypothetical protein
MASFALNAKMKITPAIGAIMEAMVMMTDVVFVAMLTFASFDDCVLHAHQNRAYERLPEQCVRVAIPKPSLAPLYTIRPLKRPEPADG